MATHHRWLLLPPAVALLLVLGPLSMQDAGPGTGSTPDPVPDPAAGTGARPALPRGPDPWQLTSTLVGVLLLGGVTLFVLRRARRGATPAGGAAIVLRQSLRLSPRQTLHAVEFEGRLLLVGEGERGATLVHAGAPADPAADDAAVAERALPDEDDGAVPRDLILPRPARPPAPPRTAAPAARGRERLLHDFRSLLTRAGR